MVFKFVKKIVKGISKVVRKIGRGIKKTFAKIGKFMGKIGIIGQIGLALILPGVGQVLSGLLVGTTPGVVGGLAGTLQGMGAVGQAASSFIQGAVKLASNTSKFFSSISDGVTQVVGDTIGAAAQSLGITAESTIGTNLSKIGINMDVDGWGGIFTNAEKSFGKITDAGSKLFDLSSPVGDPTTTALAQKQTQLTESVSEGLQPKAEGMTTFDVTSPVGETVVQQPSLLTSEVPRPAVTTVTSAPPTVLESIQAGSYTTDATGRIVPKASLQPEKSLLDKTSEFLTGRTSDELLDVGRAKIAKAATDFIPETGKALGTEFLAQASGLSPTAEEMTPRYYSSSVALGDMSTSIGVDTVSPYQGIIDQVGVQFASANPYGLMAQQYNFDQYQMAMKERGYA